MKIIAILVILFVPILCLSQQSKTETELLGQTIGYIYGQSSTLSLIGSKYHDLTNSTVLAQAEFNLAFGKAQTNIEKELSIALKGKYADIKTNMISAIKHQLDINSLSKHEALEFIEKVILRSKGEISSPVKETLLTYQYLEYPEGEIIHGFKQVCATKEHPKSKGIDFQISVPVSWSIQEGDRPNVIKKAVSKNGKGNEMVILIVSESGITSITSRVFTSDWLKNFLPKGSRYISSKEITLDRNKGGMIEFEQIVEQLDFKFRVRGLIYIVPFKSKILHLQCFTGGQESQVNIEASIEKFRPLFRMIANSLVINNQYQ